MLLEVNAAMSAESVVSVFFCAAFVVLACLLTASFVSQCCIMKPGCLVAVFVAMTGFMVAAQESTQL